MSNLTQQGWRFTAPPQTNADLRRAAHGPIQPMPQPSWLDRLLGRVR